MTASSQRQGGLLDTSVFIAQDDGRSPGALPEEVAISVVTVAELKLGMLLAEQIHCRQ